MNRKWIIAALLAGMAAPAIASAQNPAPTPAPAPRARRAPRAESRSWTYVSSNRGRIGVLVATDADADKDKIGARLEAVTPGGPAADAGLKAGDIITRFNGTALGGVESENDEESGPGNKLIELARDLDPGDTVKVDYRRGTETKSATIVAEDMGGGFAFTMPEMPRMPEAPLMPSMPRVQVGPMGGDFGFTIFSSPWGGLELVSLNPDLGEYFGTREGLLVVKTPSDSSLSLKAGDVILGIDGRKPTSPSQAMRILGTYEESDTVKIDVMRHNRRTSVTWVVPDRDHMRMMPRERRPRGGGERGEPSSYRLLLPKVQVTPRVEVLTVPRVKVAVHWSGASI